LDLKKGGGEMKLKVDLSEPPAKVIHWVVGQKGQYAPLPRRSPII